MTQYSVVVAFWAFVAVAVVAAVWREIAFRREAEATIRVAIEKGQNVDPAFIETLRYSRRKEREERGLGGLLIAGLVLLGTGVGLPVMGYFIRVGGEPKAFFPLMGVGALLDMIAVALLLAWRIATRRLIDARVPPPA